MSRRVLLLGGVCAVLVAGCGRGDDERQARAVAERFYAAVADHQGQRACRQLTEATAEELAKSEGKPCPQAATELKLSAQPRAISGRVYVTSAEVELAGGETAFLDKTDHGWRISAAGCKPQAEQPYDCEVQD